LTQGTVQNHERRTTTAHQGSLPQANASPPWRRSYVDTAPSVAFCGAAQQYLDSRVDNRTQVLAASLTSIEQVMQLAGIRHITISPPLLATLAASPAADWPGAASIGDVIKNVAAAAAAPERQAQLEALVNDESGWRMAFTRAGAGAAETKLVQALNIFVDMQEKLEEIVRRADVAMRADST
jgi:hypothetical protein